MSLMDQIRKSTDATKPGGLSGPNAVALAACLPDLEKIADRLLRMAGEANEEMSEAEALAAANKIREAMLETLEEILMDTEEDG